MQITMQSDGVVARQMFEATLKYPGWEGALFEGPKMGFMLTLDSTTLVFFTDEGKFTGEVEYIGSNKIWNMLFRPAGRTAAGYWVAEYRGMWLPIIKVTNSKRDLINGNPFN